MESRPMVPGSRMSSFALHGVVAAVITVAALVTRMQYTLSDDCTAQLSEGRWIGGHWYPLHCIMHDFETSEVLHCLQRRGNMILIGDQHMEMYYKAIRNAIAPDGEPRLADLRRKEIFENFFSSVHMKGVVEYRPHDNLDREALEEYKTLSKRVAVNSQVVIHMPSQFHTEGKQGEQMVVDCKAKIDQLVQAQMSLLTEVTTTPSPDSDTPPGKPPNRLLILQLSPSVYSNGPVSRNMEACEEYALQKYSVLHENQSWIQYLKYPRPPQPSPPPTHPPNSTSDRLVPLGISLILNSFCNALQNATCCVHQGNAYYHYAVIPTLIAILAIYCGVFLIFASGATFALTPHLEAMSFNLKTFFSVFNSVGCLTAIFFVFLLVDRLDFLFRNNKFQSPFLLCVSMVAIFLCGMIRTTPEKVEFMSQELTNEWKGWMILSLVAINYSGMEQVVPFNLFVQLLVGGFLFLIGYGHFMSFWNGGDYSRGRMAKVLFQVNILPVCACLTLGSPYGAYSLIVLLSASTLFVFIFMSSWPSVSKGWLRELSSPSAVMAVKFAGAFLLISMLPYIKVWVLPILSRTLVSAIFESHDGCPFAIYYWFLAERHLTFWGMLFAYIVTMVRANHQVNISRLKTAGAIFTVFAIMAYTAYVLSAQKQDVQSTDSGHSYIAVLPLLAYIYLRSFLQDLHGSYSTILHALGRHSVWVYVSHFHLLLALNGAGHLAFFPGHDFLNAVSVGIVYFFITRVVMVCSDTLSKHLFGKPTVTFTV